MKLTKDILIQRGACYPGLKTFDDEAPTGEWNSSQDACLQLRDKWPWRWLGENTLSAAGKMRFLRMLVEARQKYEADRQVVIAQLVNGIATDEMKATIQKIEDEYKNSEAVAFAASADIP